VPGARPLAAGFGRQLRELKWFKTGIAPHAWEQDGPHKQRWIIDVGLGGWNRSVAFIRKRGGQRP